ncbi:MAG: pyruvate ferredoxin oxidoreductase [Planctomycetes bacterium]|nr:pyruvate ferredoxin oxidoreductase [Planctomycetota bacterium]
MLTGNQAAAYGAYLSQVQVVSAYPITPQTTVIETLAELYRDAPWPSRFVNVESEHSAMAACIGASMAGARAFTATSSQGLALMHELLHWASAQRLPLVMVNVNRALAPGWNIWTDQNDSLSQRDTGWMQLYCESNQEALDTVIQAYRVAEQVQIPIMVVLDAFVLSHTAEAVSLPSPEMVRAFLPPRDPPFRLDVEEPHAFGGLLTPDHYQEVRAKLHRGMEDAIPIWGEAERSWEAFTGRAYDAVVPYRTEDAEMVLVASATVASTARDVIDALRARGKKVGLLRVRLFRPTPHDALRLALRGIPRVAVIDRNISYGHHGIFFQEIKSALYDLPARERPGMFGYVTGLGGRDVTRGVILDAVGRTLSRDRAEPETVWIGRKE